MRRTNGDAMHTQRLVVIGRRPGLGKETLLAAVRPFVPQDKRVLVVSRDGLGLTWRNVREIIAWGRNGTQVALGEAVRMATRFLLECLVVDGIRYPHDAYCALSTVAAGFEEAILVVDTEDGKDAVEQLWHLCSVACGEDEARRLVQEVGPAAVSVGLGSAET